MEHLADIATILGAVMAAVTTIVAGAWAFTRIVSTFKPDLVRASTDYTRELHERLAALEEKVEKQAERIGELERDLHDERESKNEWKIRFEVERERRIEAEADSTAARSAALLADERLREHLMACKAPTDTDLPVAP